MSRLRASPTTDGRQSGPASVCVDGVWQGVMQELDDARLLESDESFAHASFTPAHKGGA
jgi:hypothetical protein